MLYDSLYSLFLSSPEGSPHDNYKLTDHDMPSPIVFAITVWEAGNKCVDYYMTWRGNPVRCFRVCSVVHFAYIAVLYRKLERIEVFIVIPSGPTHSLISSSQTSTEGSPFSMQSSEGSPNRWIRSIGRFRMFLVIHFQLYMT
jgi:hypothetical protein